MSLTLSETSLNELKSYYIDKLKTLLAIESTYDEGTISDGQPFGEGIQEALQYMLALGEESGFQSKNVDGYAGHIEWGNGEDLIGILGHLDVVPGGEGWTHPPFEPYVEDGKIFARGAQDDKGPVMAAFLAMKWLHELGFQPKKRIRLIMGTDEERDWQCMNYYFKQEEMPSIGFSPDSSFPVTHAEKGLVDIEVTNSIESEEGHALQLVTFHAGERLNMVPYRANATLTGESLHNVQENFLDYIEASDFNGTAQLEDERLHLTLTGESAHAQEPNDGRSAWLGMVEFLCLLPLAPSLKESLTAQHRLFKDTRGEALEIRSEDEMSGPLTVNVGYGTYENNSLNLGVNIRYPVTDTLERWEPTFREQLQSLGYDVHIREHLAPIYFEKDHPLVQQLLDIYNKHTGEDAVPESIGGATYARALDQGVAYGAMFPHHKSTAHQVDEHVSIDDMMKAAFIYAEAIYTLAN
ncbi:hypothetical protein N781_09240 [Pontibacillus halophilus JSM 076056 = DSM 19796]|uniref:Dipeptidase PepV n=1 Tax=Pontibacillus halophilus JSM 076056 = DSM 19796 TaxID=1385510 RepID=A0A0A5GE64_9BACI|nr:dipeptidase PepV [Pontibacillus halophilus]KGX89425.1 hypothetical protein N781_09240 [Pontibacillus halophilus JSM 076056 = DSM 19796]